MKQNISTIMKNYIIKLVKKNWVNINQCTIYSLWMHDLLSNEAINSLITKIQTCLNKIKYQTTSNNKKTKRMPRKDWITSAILILLISYEKKNIYIIN